MGTGEEEGKGPPFDFLRRNSSQAAGSRTGAGKGGAPIFKDFLSFPGAGLFSKKASPRELQGGGPPPAPGSQIVALGVLQPPAPPEPREERQPPLWDPRADSRAGRDAAAARLQLYGALLPRTPAPAPRTSAAAEPQLGIPTVTAPLAGLGVSRFSASQ
ncbi:uncharacterized protein LOC120892567 [Ictidomys tridecemlineatus]